MTSRHMILTRTSLMNFSWLIGADCWVVLSAPRDCSVFASSSRSNCVSSSILLTPLFRIGLAFNRRLPRSCFLTSRGLVLPGGPEALRSSRNVCGECYQGCAREVDREACPQCVWRFVLNTQTKLEEIGANWTNRGIPENMKVMLEQPGIKRGNRIAGTSRGDPK